MLEEEKRRRQGDLEKNIYELSKKMFSPDDVRSISLKLLEIYKGGFHHSYASFFTIILDISKEDNSYNLDYLSNNLESIRAYVESDYVSGTKEFEDIYKPLNKLSDNLNIEIGRLIYYSQNEQKIEDLQTARDEMIEATDVLSRASKQASSIQTELIAVLSIFAAIVITFSGGFTFLGSVMTSISSVICEELVLIAIICGMVIFNTIFLLMYLVGKITDRNIYAGCVTKDCSSCEEKCSNLRILRKRLPYVFYFDLLCIIGIIADCIIWYLGIEGHI